MVEGDLDAEKVENNTGTKYTQSGSQSQGSGLRREPSFSRWCDEDGRVHLNHQLGDRDPSVEEDSDFELPLLEQGEIENKVLTYHNTKRQQGSMHLNGGDTIDDPSTPVEGNGTKKFVPFDIENGSPRKENGVGDSIYTHNHKPLPPTLKDPISAANVLKTLFFILLWYTFSLFLTL